MPRLISTSATIIRPRERPLREHMLSRDPGSEVKSDRIYCLCGRVAWLLPWEGGKLGKHEGSRRRLPDGRITKLWPWPNRREGGFAGLDVTSAMGAAAGCHSGVV